MRRIMGPCPEMYVIATGSPALGCDHVVEEEDLHAASMELSAR